MDHLYPLKSTLPWYLSTSLMALTAYPLALRDKQTSNLVCLD
jgi:hypothetical protein